MFLRLRLLGLNLYFVANKYRIFNISNGFLIGRVAIQCYLNRQTYIPTNAGLIVYFDLPLPDSIAAYFFYSHFIVRFPHGVHT